LAEHHPIQRSVLVNILAMGGARVSTAPSALAAADQLESAVKRGEPPRVLLIEHGLPDQNGLWTVARMRERLGPALPPVLLLISLGAVSDAEAKAAGCARTLLKPVKRDTLLGAMAHALNESSGAVESLKSASPTIARKIRVLVAEDNRVNQVLMSKLLQSTSQIEVAVNGLEAIERLRASDFDLIFMDCHMPELDGYEATRRIRMGDAGVNAQNLPIIALTANAMSGDRERCLEAGMTDFMTKPVNPTLLRAMVDKYAVSNPGAVLERPTADHPAAAS
jgi:CheY-like chemotaxis protein